MPMLSCVVEGCDLKVYSHGYCAMHNSRFLRYGDPGEAGRRRGVVPRSYKAMHTKLRNSRGKASNHQCQCGKTAYDWALIEGAVSVVPESSPVWSTDVSEYRPLCRPCHWKYDGKVVNDRPCSEDGCELPCRSRGLCSIHYQRDMKLRRAG